MNDARLSLRPFSKTDWYGFGGAEPFADGSDPLIGELKNIAVELDGAPAVASAVVILDATGLSIVPLLENEAVGTVFEYFVNFDHPYAARALASLRDGLSMVEIKAFPGATVLS